jgi:hypothetical protein
VRTFARIELIAGDDAVHPIRRPGAIVLLNDPR